VSITWFAYNIPCPALYEKTFLVRQPSIDISSASISSLAIAAAPTKEIRASDMLQALNFIDYPHTSTVYDSTWEH
jgi:hypothetical protein